MDMAIGFATGVAFTIVASFLFLFFTGSLHR